MEKFELVIESNNTIPKYLQIVNGIKELIRSKKLGVGDMLPSVRKICMDYQLSQETVLKSFNELQKTGIVKSELRKGYFVASDSVEIDRNIFMLFDDLSEYKKILYNAIRVGLEDPNSKIDVFFHHCNPQLFDTLISNNINDYNRFIVMPFDDPQIKPVLDKLRDKEVLYLDRKENVDESKNNFIVQDFNDSVYQYLQSAVDKIKKYKKFLLVFPNTDSIVSNAAKAPKEINLGFTRFCQDYNIHYEIVDRVEEVQANESYFVIDDLDLVSVITMAKNNHYELGNEVGLLSYNESPIKNVIADGITVISTNYKKLGEKVVSYVLENKKDLQEIISTELIIRKSL